MLTVALCAMVLMRLVDLSVFDVTDDHHKMPNQVISHSIGETHSTAEDEDHEVGDVHMQFHTLLGAYILTQAEVFEPVRTLVIKFQIFAGKNPVTSQARPPVPPPLF